PMVPVSWPPCPASTTILPIFSPSARIRERSPLCVGAAVRAEAAVLAGSGVFFLRLLRLDSCGAIAWNVGPEVGLLLKLDGLSMAVSSTTILGGSAFAISTVLSLVDLLFAVDSAGFAVT